MIEWLWGVKFFFHVELWAKNTNPHNCHTPFEIPNKKVLRETLYNTKNPPRIFLDLRVGPILAVFSLMLQNSFEF